VARARVHILANKTQELPPQLGIAVQVLQRPQDWDDLIPTIQIQGYVADGQAIQTLFRTSQTHVNSSGKIGALSREMPMILHLGRRLAYNLHCTIRSKTPEISGFCHFATDTNYGSGSYAHRYYGSYYSPGYSSNYSGSGYYAPDLYNSPGYYAPGYYGGGCP
jgi:hypothetical protein